MLFPFRTMKTNYVLQTLWRDYSSEIDIVGPYYTSHGPADAKFAQVYLERIELIH